MKIVASAPALQTAFGLAALVTPKAGYLLESAGGETTVSSQDGSRKIKVKLECKADDGVRVVIPATKDDIFRHLEGDVTIEPFEAEGVPSVRVEDSLGASQEFVTSDPRSVKSVQFTPSGSPDEFPAALLKEGLGRIRHSVVSPSDPKADDLSKTAQLFGSKVGGDAGNGFFYASDKVRVGYFYSAALKCVNGFEVHLQHLPVLLQALGKSDGLVSIYNSDGWYYMVADSLTFGWARTDKAYQKLLMYGWDAETHALSLNKALALKALKQVRTALDPKEDRIRIQYSDGNLTFQGADAGSKAKSRAVPTKVAQVRPSKGQEDTEFSCNVGLNALIEAVEHSAGSEIELRYLQRTTTNSEGDVSTQHMFRVVDEFKVGSGKGQDEGFQCMAIRFMPSRR